MSAYEIHANTAGDVSTQKDTSLVNARADITENVVSKVQYQIKFGIFEYFGNLVCQIQVKDAIY